MPSYSTGLETRESILQSAKQLFYENGFTKTSLQQISKAASIRQSLLFYYFKNKDELAIEIFNEFSEIHNSLICKRIKDLDLNLSVSVERYVYVASSQRVLLSNKPLSLFIGEINHNFVQMNSEFIKDKYQILFNEHPSSIQKTNLDLVMIQNIGFNTVMYKLYMEELLEKYSIDELIRFKLRTSLRSIYYEDNKIEPFIDEIMSLEYKINFKVEPFFKISYCD